MRRATTGILSAFLIAAAAIPPLGSAFARNGYYPSQPQQQRSPQQRDYRYQPDPRYRPERGGYLNSPTCGVDRTCGYR
jgi:hypothetical protein